MAYQRGAIAAHLQAPSPSSTPEPASTDTAPIMGHFLDATGAAHKYSAKIVTTESVRVLYTVSLKRLLHILRSTDIVLASKTPKSHNIHVQALQTLRSEKAWQQDLRLLVSGA